MNLVIDPQTLDGNYGGTAYIEIGFSSPTNFVGLYYPMDIGLIETLSETYYRLNFIDNAGYFGSIPGGQERVQKVDFWLITENPNQ